MSDCYYLACRSCKRHVWIGQSANATPPFGFYSGESETMEELRVFLWERRGHSLVVDDSQILEYQDVIHDGEEDDNA